MTLLSYEIRATTTGNMYRIFLLISGLAIFSDMRADRQTNRQTDMLITILRTPTGDEITKICTTWMLYHLSF